MSDAVPRAVTAVDIDGNTYEALTSELSWRPSAYGIVIRDDNLLVLRQRSGYDLPGGGIDFGEMPEEAVVREVKEESGIEVNKPQLLGVASTFFKFAHVPTNQTIQSIMIYYACSFVGGELTNDGFDEHESIYAHGAEWWPLSKLDELQISSSNDFRSYVRQLV